MRAFAAVVYLHVEYEGQIPEINLVASKTRVALIKRQPIPRLELLGATILAHLMDTVLDKARMSLCTIGQIHIPHFAGLKAIIIGNSMFNTG